MTLAIRDRQVVVNVGMTVAGPRRKREEWRFALVALLISIPCLWQEHIQSVDLSSHLYNAWVVNEVNAGHLPGLHVATQFTNVLFDVALSSLLKLTGGVAWTERIAVVAAVQIFFWGCFVFVSAAANSRAWQMAPVLAMLAYGAVFRIGFFNFYISTGLCLIAMALVWNGARPRLAVFLLLSACTAHFLPCIWATCAISYMWLMRRVSARRQILLPGISAVAILAISGCLTLFVPALLPTGVRVDSLVGVDQLLMWGAKYRVVAAACFCCYVLLLICRFELDSPFRDVIFQLWVLSAIACLVLPDAVWLPFYASGLSYVTIRLSLLCGILLCAVIAKAPTPKVVQLTLAIAAVIFFGLSYRDEGALNRVEDRMQKAVAALPAGTRVIAAVRDPHLFVQGLEHMIDRPCIGRCFDYGNYEASTSQFRLRADAGNSYVVSNNGDVGALEHGRLVFSRKDITVYRVFECGAKFCASPLSPGEPVGTQELDSLGWRKD